MKPVYSIFRAEELQTVLSQRLRQRVTPNFNNVPPECTESQNTAILERREIVSYTSTQNMEGSGYSKILVTIYRTTRYHIPENKSSNEERWVSDRNLQSQIAAFILLIIFRLHYLNKILYCSCAIYVLQSFTLVNVNLKSISL